MGNKTSAKSTSELKKYLISGYVRKTATKNVTSSLQCIISLYYGSFFWIRNMKGFKKLYTVNSAAISNRISKSMLPFRIHCTRKSDQKIFSLEITTIKNYNEHQKKEFNDKLKSILNLNHPNILKMYEIYGNKQKIYTVSEPVEGGQLFDLIIGDIFEANIDRPIEHQSALFLKQILKALSYLHDIGIVHTNIKPENLWLTSKSYYDAQIKLTDFTLSKSIYDNNWYLDEIRGTIYDYFYYTAPEILKREKYDTKCDLWSVGVVLYFMIVGYPPFYDQPEDSMDEAITFKQIKKGEYIMNNKDWDNISNAAKDLMTKLLEVNPNKRLSAKQALQHEWIYFLGII